MSLYRLLPQNASQTLSNLKLLPFSLRVLAVQAGNIICENKVQSNRTFFVTSFFYDAYISKLFMKLGAADFITKYKEQPKKFLRDKINNTLKM